jgi:hypothetical protein
VAWIQPSDVSPASSPSRYRVVANETPGGAALVVVEECEEGNLLVGGAGHRIGDRVGERLL